MVNDDRIASPKQIQTGIDFGWATYGDITPCGIDFRIVFIHLQNLLQLTGGAPLRGHCHSILNIKHPQVFLLIANAVQNLLGCYLIQANRRDRHLLYLIRSQLLECGIIYAHRSNSRPLIVSICQIRLCRIAG